jgi:uncharacterized protein with HEPN domain
MSKRRPEVRLEHVHESIVFIERYLGDRGDRELAGFPMLRDAIERRLEIIGEAVTALRRDFPAVLATEPSIDWARIAGLRVVLAHAYDKVDPEILLETIKQDLPPLKEAVRRLLAKS